MSETAANSAAAAKTAAKEQQAKDPGGKDHQAVKALAEQLYAALDENKAENIVMLNIGGRSALADYMLIAGGSSARQVNALADRLLRLLKEEGHKNVQAEGLGSGDWVLIDAGDVIIHLFRPEARAFYRLENIWAEQAENSGE